MAALDVRKTESLLIKMCDAYTLPTNILVSAAAIIK